MQFKGATLSLPTARFEGIYQIDTIFKNKFSDRLIPQLQQMGSDLQETVEVDMDVKSEYKFYNFSAPRTARKSTDLFGDTPINHQEYSRRRLSMTEYEDGDLITDVDKIKAAADPTSDIQTEMRYAFGRAKDEEIIDAMDADVYTGKEGGTLVSLPAAQTVAVATGSTAATGMNVAKLRRAKRLLDAARVPKEEQRFAVMTARQFEELLAITEVTSADYNSVRALVNGDINTYLGFKFIQNELLETDASGYRKCLFYTKKAIKFGIGKDLTAYIYNRGDKKMNVQVFAKMYCGAVRLHDQRVVIGLCDES